MKTQPIFHKTLYLFSIIALMLIAVSCKDDDKKDPEPEFTFVGEWQYTNITLANGNPFPFLPTLKATIPCLDNTKFVFGADKSFSAKDCQDAIDYLSPYIPFAAGTTWEDKNGKIVLKNGTMEKEFQYTKSKNTAGKDQLDFIVPITLPAVGDLDTKLTFVKQ